MEDAAKTRYLAHVRPDSNGGWKEHSLEEHLQKVSRLAGEFAQPFGGTGWAALAGLWHDLGKYSRSFQDYIRSASGYERQDAHVEIEDSPKRVNHSSAGAIFACEKMGARGRLLAYLIAGHHAGLPDWSTAETGAAALEYRLTTKEQLDELPFLKIPSEIINPGILLSNKPLGGTDWHCGCVCCFPAWWMRIFSIPKPSWMGKGLPLAGATATLPV